MTLDLAIAALKSKKFQEARDRVAHILPETYTPHHFLVKGLAELALEAWSEAQTTFEQATERYPDNAMFWFNRALAEENQDLIIQAIASQKRGLSINPDYAPAYGNLSNLYRKQKRFVEAEVMAQEALEKGASEADAFNCLGLALGRQGKFNKARHAFIKAHAANPDNEDVLLNRANLEVDVLDFAKAWFFFSAARALSDKPVIRHDEGLARLLAGDFKKGFELFEARLELPEALRLCPSCPRWQGEPLAGKKLLIVAEQGFGDTIQFCRYNALLTQGELVWAVPSSLVRLLEGNVRGTVLDETAPLPACDYYVPIMSLPYVIQRWDWANLPLTLHVPDGPVLPRTKDDYVIGLVWKGSPTHARDHERSLPLSLFKPLIDAVKATYVAPFVGEGLNDIGDLPITPLNDRIQDFADTAALLKQMDCVVTVDTAVAHLAGALGIKTFVLLPTCPDWRWGTQGETTPLYPSLTLLRQKTYGEWDVVIETLGQKLNVMTRS